jgi:hypothetical protein
MPQRSPARAEVRVPVHRPQTSRPHELGDVPSPLVDLALRFLASDAFEIACNIAAALKARGYGRDHFKSARPFEQDNESAQPPKWEPEGDATSTTWRHIALARLSAYAERDLDTGCLNWRGGVQQGGYGVVSYRRGRYTAHRLSWLAQRGPIPKDMLVCHTCDNRLCIEVTHLFLGTAQDNTTDMARKGRGRFYSRARLSEGAVARIKRRLLDGVPAATIARENSVHYRTIHEIKTNRSWRHVEAAPGADDEEE